MISTISFGSTPQPKYSESVGTMWMFPKIVGFSPQIMHFFRVFHYFHHPFWWFYHYFWKRLCRDLPLKLCQHPGRGCQISSLVSAQQLHGGRASAWRWPVVNGGRGNGSCQFIVLYWQYIYLGGGNSNIFCFHPENWGNDPNFLNIFHMGWNHQLVMYTYIDTAPPENLHVDLENSGAFQKEHHFLSSPYFSGVNSRLLVFGGRADIANWPPAAWFYQKKNEVNNP